jgi:hypothetical protein
MVTGASDVAFEEQADMSLTASDVCKRPKPGVARGPPHPDDPAMVKASGRLEPKLDKLSEPR